MKLPPSVHDLLKVSTMTLATITENGSPHAAPVYFAAAARIPGDNLPLLYFFSSSKSQHSQDILARPLAAAAIYPDTIDWRAIQCLQLHGWVRLVPAGPEWELAFQSYQNKFPFVAALQAEVARNTLYVFEPTWIRLVDNRQEFGSKEEWQLG